MKSVSRSMFRLAMSALLLAATVRAQEASDQTIELEVGRSRSIRTAWRVAGAWLTDPEVAEVQMPSPELVLVSGKKPGATDLILVGEGGEEASYLLDVSLDLAPMKVELARLFPGSDLLVDQTGSTLVLTGALASADQVERLRLYMDALGFAYVDMTSLPGVQQVHVHVRVAEVSRTGIRQLGINAFAAGEDGFAATTIGPSQGGPINPIDIGPPEGASVTDTPFLFNRAIGVSPAVTLFAGVSSANMEIFISALAENQYLRLLAEPNLIALSGEQASFLVGGEFPIPIAQGGAGVGGTSITIEYKEFGVGLRFSPLVLGEGRIRLAVSSEVSELTDIGAVEIQGFRIPGVVTRRTDTTVEMNSGETFAMAGLLSESVNAQVSKTPWLGQIPILGSLFRSVRYKKNETELLVLVTADLVAPMSQSVLPPLPGADHVVPSDWEVFSLGRIEGKPAGRISSDQADWLREHGLSDLSGPGAWATHEGASPTTRRPYERPAEKQGAQAETSKD